MDWFAVHRGAENLKNSFRNIAASYLSDDRDIDIEPIRSIVETQALLAIEYVEQRFYDRMSPLVQATEVAQKRYEIAADKLEQLHSVQSSWRNSHELSVRAVAESIDSVQTTIGKLSTRIAKRRRRLLFAWDGIAPAAFVAGCLIVGLPEFFAGINRAWHIPEAVTAHVADIGCAINSGTAGCLTEPTEKQRMP